MQPHTAAKELKRVSSHSSHTSKGAELPVLKAAPIIMLALKAPITKVI